MAPDRLKFVGGREESAPATVADSGAGYPGVIDAVTSRWERGRHDHRHPRAPGRPGLDVAGTALATLGLTAIVLPLVEGRAHGGPAWTWASLATMQNVGGALGVAVIGVLFYGALPHGLAPAFELNVGALAVTLTAVAALDNPGPSGTAGRPRTGGSS
jgi:hypothetical protein